MNRQAFEISPIGVVLSDSKDTFNIPTEGVSAKIKVFKRYAEALKGIRDYSHLLVICWLHLADTAEYRSILKVRPVRIDPDLPETGVFAGRTPIRPNPLSLTVVRLRSVHENILSVDDLDVVDGTPVIDIKPYSPATDCIHSAKSRPLSVRKHKERLTRTFFRQAVNFHGMACPGVALGVRMVIETLVRMGIDDEKDRSIVVRAEKDGCVLDAVEAVTGATVGNGRLTLACSDKISLTFSTGKGERALRVSLRPTFQIPSSPAGAVQLLLEADAEELLRFEDIPVCPDLKRAAAMRAGAHLL